MRNKKPFIALTVCALVGISAFVGLKTIDSNSNSSNNHKQTTASGAGEPVYFLIQDLIDGSCTGWTKDKTYYLRYYCPNNEQKGYLPLQAADNTGYYYYIDSLPTLTGGGFCIRNSNSGSDDLDESTWVGYNSWVSQEFNGLEVTTQDDGGRRHANWKKFKDIKKSVQKPSTFRVFVSIGSNEFWLKDGCKTCVRYVADGSEKFSFMTEVTNSEDKKYWYSDIPTNVSGFQFVRLSKDQTAIHNYTDYIQSEMEGCVVYYINKRDGEGDQPLSKGSPDNVNISLASAAVDSLLCCSTSILNGRGVYNNLSNYFLSESKFPSAQLEIFKATSVNDYSQSDYKAAGGKYTDEMTKSFGTTYGAKLDALSVPTDNPPILPSNTNTAVTNSAIIISVASVLALSAFCLILIRKKKLN